MSKEALVNLGERLQRAALILAFIIAGAVVLWRLPEIYQNIVNSL